MQRTLKSYFIILLKGMAMGAADVVPGVSGGTIAFISGIYQELIETISGINLGLITTWKKEGFKAMWHKANGNFLSALVAGGFISVFSLMKVVHFLLENHPVKLWAFFFGLVLASIIYIGKQIKNWSAITILAIIISAVFAFSITQLGTFQESDNLFFLFVAGAIASCAMILPGISGSFILVLLGAYATIIDAVHNVDITKIAVVGFGVLTGVLSFSHLLKWLFKNYENLTLAILTGFILGSLNKIWPWKHTLESIVIDGKTKIIKEASVLPSNFETEPHLLSAIVLAIVGFTFILILEKLASKK